MRRFFFSALVGLSLIGASAPVFAHGTQGVSTGGNHGITRQFADGGDYVVTNQQTADGGDYVGNTPGAAGPANT